jgi:hypothetical protein
MLLMGKIFLTSPSARKCAWTIEIEAYVIESIDLEGEITVIPSFDYGSNR